MEYDKNKNDSRLISILDMMGKMQLGEDGIYGYAFTNVEQALEIKMREQVAVVNHDNLLYKINKHHSIPVMDFEVDRFLQHIPYGGRIIDVGGCWGWHWRTLQETRPDIQVFILDFVRENLLYARDLLGNVINESIFLIHGDATSINFPDESFDGYWSVQVLQHVVLFEKALTEAHRIIKRGGIFASYSLNDCAVIRWLSRIAGRRYLKEGWVDGSFWLARASNEQKMLLQSIFKTKVHERLSEILYKPEFHAYFIGKEGNWLGGLDALLSNNRGYFGFLARQKSFHCTKN